MSWHHPPVQSSLLQPGGGHWVAPPPGTAYSISCSRVYEVQLAAKQSVRVTEAVPLSSYPAPKLKVRPSTLPSQLLCLYNLTSNKPTRSISITDLVTTEFWSQGPLYIQHITPKEKTRPILTQQHISEICRFLGGGKEKKIAISGSLDNTSPQTK